MKKVKYESQLNLRDHTTPVPVCEVFMIFTLLLNHTTPVPVCEFLFCMMNGIHQPGIFLEYCINSHLNSSVHLDSSSSAFSGSR
jgi:hypothetical protein